MGAPGASSNAAGWPGSGESPGTLSARFRLADLLAGLSVACDLGFGLPPEEAMRSCIVATALARKMGLEEGVVADTFYTAPHRRGDREAGVRACQKDAGCGQRMKAKEAGGRQERERDQEDSRVAPPAGCRPGGIGERRVDCAGDQDEPEVGRVVLPAHVEVGLRHEQRQASHRKHEEDG